ncbi:amidohydrolase family protein [Nonomuraea sp. KM88]|uniref:amidohydrolase family protein n=1 Tax=Nonomuraea sp. KM88 TaxID=3457427 RepID=UPI003FCE5F52
MSAGRTRLDVAFVLVHDGREHRLVRDGSVIYEGDTITYAGPRTDTAADVEEHLPHALLSPGFISLHNHLSFGSIDRSLREDRRSEHFYGSTLFEYVLPMMHAVTPELSALTTRLSIAELLRSGVTTCVDVTDTPDVTVAAAGESGLRTYVGEAFTSHRRVIHDGHRIGYERHRHADDERSAAQAVASALRVNGRFAGLVNGMVAPGAVDTCSPSLLAETARAAREAGLLLTTHCGQSRLEFHDIIARYGCTPVQLLDRAGFLGRDVILAHCVFIDSHSATRSSPSGRDLDLLGRSATTVAHCPTQFARTGVLLEDFGRYLAAGVTMALSTDAAPQCMLTEMRLGAILAKNAAGNTGAVGARELFHAATIGGAQALGRGDLGRVSRGAKADLVIFRTDTPGLTPLRDPVKSIVYHAGPQDVTRVVVNGRTVARDGTIANLDTPALARRVQTACEQQVWPGLTGPAADAPGSDDARRFLREKSPNTRFVPPGHAVHDAGDITNVHTMTSPYRSEYSPRARLMAEVGLRVNEARSLDPADVKWELGRFGKLHVRLGKGTRGSGPREGLSSVCLPHRPDHPRHPARPPPPLIGQGPGRWTARAPRGHRYEVRPYALMIVWTTESSPEPAETRSEAKSPAAGLFTDADHCPSM